MIELGTYIRASSRVILRWLFFCMWKTDMRYFANSFFFFTGQPFSVRALCFAPVQSTMLPLRGVPEKLYVEFNVLQVKKTFHARRLHLANAWSVANVKRMSSLTACR